MTAPSWALTSLLVVVGVVVLIGARSIRGDQLGPSTNIAVTTTTDSIDALSGDGICADATGNCSVRAAIQESNFLPGPQTILLASGTYELALSGCCESASLSGDLDILDDVTIRGTGPDDSFITWEETAVSERIFDVAQDVVVVVSNLNLGGVFMNQFTEEDEKCGGGIRNAGNLTLTLVRIHDNVMRGSGGGICNEAGGILRIRDSVIDGNGAALAGSGGGLLNLGSASLERTSVTSNNATPFGGAGIDNYGTLTLRDSLISDNRSGDSISKWNGAGIRNSGDGATAVITNSTIANNEVELLFDDTDGSEVGGGGVTTSAGAQTVVINSTVTDNHSGGSDGGVATYTSATTTLVNTIIAGNEGADCSADDNAISPISDGHNFDSDGTCGLDGPGDISNADPLLGPLADNGGPTLTHALLAGSVAIDAGDPAQCSETDQRGAPRDNECDIGAYEADAIVPTPGPTPRGDLDCDGAVTLVDALFALGSAADTVGLPQCAGATGDADCDGDIDGVDGLLIVKQVADLPVETCVPT